MATGKRKAKVGTRLAPSQEQKVIYLRLPGDVLADVRNEAKADDRSVTVTISRALREYYGSKRNTKLASRREEIRPLGE